MQVLYVVVAVLVYLFTAAELFRAARPESFREAVAGALACAVVAAVWPLALLWRGLLGGGPTAPVRSPSRATEARRSEA